MNFLVGIAQYYTVKQVSLLKEQFVISEPCQEKIILTTKRENNAIKDAGTCLRSSSYSSSNCP